MSSLPMDHASADGMNTYIKRYIFDNHNETYQPGSINSLLRYDLSFSEDRTTSVEFVGSISVYKNKYLDVDLRHEYTDVEWLDDFSCWTVFMMYWPAVAFYSLIGKE